MSRTKVTAIMTVCAAIAMALLVPATGIANTVTYSGYAKGERGPEFYQGSVTFHKDGARISLYDHFSKCGEFSTPLVHIRGDGTFSYKDTSKNGYGIKLSGRVTHARVKGQIQTWSPMHRCDTGSDSYVANRN